MLDLSIPGVLLLAWECTPGLLAVETSQTCGMIRTTGLPYWPAPGCGDKEQVPQTAGITSFTSITSFPMS